MRRSKAIEILTELAEQFDVHPNQITIWKAQLESGAADIFRPNGTATAQPAIDVKSLHAKIGELTLENFLEASVSRGYASETFAYEAIAAHGESEQDYYVYYLGDFDRSERDAAKRQSTADKQWPYDFACELDAIDPDALRELVEGAINHHLPQEQLEILKVAEERRPRVAGDA